MKNIYIMLLLCAIPCITHAADTMCVKPTTTVVVLDPAINGTALSSAVTGKTWSTEFSYGIISGVGACSVSGGSEGALASDQNMTPYTTGNACYCKMLKPVESKWVYSGYKITDAYCTNNCASECSSRISSHEALRRGMFGSITLP